MQSLVYQYTVSCDKRLQWIVHTGAKRGLRKPSAEDIEQAKVGCCPHTLVPG